MVQHTVVLWALAASTTWESQVQTPRTEKGFWSLKTAPPTEPLGECRCMSKTNGTVKPPSFGVVCTQPQCALRFIKDETEVQQVLVCWTGM